MNKLFIIHCGYYENLSDTRFEMHVNLPVVAVTVEEARTKIKSHPDYLSKHMHVDGIQSLERVGEYRISIESPSS